jgi:hypothetical protein
VTRREEAVS